MRCSNCSSAAALWWKKDNAGRDERGVVISSISAQHTVVRFTATRAYFFFAFFLADFFAAAFL